MGAPTSREGQKIVDLNVSPMGYSQVSAWGSRSIVSSEHNRPVVVENQGSGLAHHNAGINRPMAYPSVSFMAGAITDKVAIAVQRCDTTGIAKRYSNLSPISPKTVDVSHSTQGQTGITLDGSTKKAFCQAFVATQYINEWARAQSAIGYDKVSLRIKGTGTLYAEFYAVDNETGRPLYPISGKSRPVTISGTSSFESKDFYFDESCAFGEVRVGVVISLSGTGTVVIDSLKGGTSSGASVPTPEDWTAGDTVDVNLLGSNLPVVGQTVDFEDDIDGERTSFLRGYVTAIDGAKFTILPDIYSVVTSGSSKWMFMGQCYYSGEDVPVSANWTINESGGAGEGFLFTATSTAKGESGITAWYSLTDGAIILDNLNAFAGDEGVDTYDALSICIFSTNLGDWKRAAIIKPLPTSSSQKWMLAQDSVDALTGADTVVPNSYDIFPACRVLKTQVGSGACRLIGVGTAGYDPYLDGALTGTFTFTGIDSDGYLTVESGSPSVGALAVVKNSDGDEVLRGVIATGPILVTAAGTQITDDQCAGDYDGLILETRAALTASVKFGSNRVTLNSSVADQYWIRHPMQIYGYGAIDIEKIATSGGTNDGSLNSGSTLGNELVLVSPWPYDDVTSGSVQILPKDKSVFIGRGSFDGLENCGLGYEMALSARTRIMTAGWCRDSLIVLTQTGEIFVVRIGAIADPNNLESAAGFDVRQFVADAIYYYSGSCVAPFSLWNNRDGEICWIGSEGVWTFDMASVTNLVGDQLKTLWYEMDQASLRNIRAAYEQSHVFTDAVRICGMSKTSSADRSGQLLYYHSRKDWVDLTGLASTDAICPVIMENGSTRTMFGGNKRLWLWGIPANRSVARDSNKFACPQMGGTRYGKGTGRSVEWGTPLPSNQFADTNANFWDVGDGSVYYQSGTRLCVIGANNMYAFGTITDRLSGTILQVTWDDAVHPALTYPLRYIIGPREFTITLPTIIAQPPYRLVSIDAVSFIIEDENPASAAEQFEWPLTIRLYGSGADPNFTSTADATRYLSRLDCQSTWTNERFALGPDYKWNVEFRGVAPPYGHLYIKSILLEVSYSV